MKFKGILIGVILLFFLIGCSSNSDSNKVDGKESESSKELKIAYSQQPASLDTHINTNTATSDVMRNVYETLLTVDSEYNVKPMLAESWEQSEDGKEITFYL